MSTTAAATTAAAASTPSDTTAAARRRAKEARDLEAARVNIFLHAENVRIFNTHRRPRLPVVVVTGFLGSGKTTLLRHLLTNKQNLRLAAAVNDFASLNIDEALIRQLPSGARAARVVELSNGCVCCSLLGSLQDAVWELLREGGDVDLDNINYLVIETSGITDPTRIVTSLDAKFGKMYRARLDAVVTVVDVDLFSQWAAPPPTAPPAARANATSGKKDESLPVATAAVAAAAAAAAAGAAGRALAPALAPAATPTIPNEVAVHQLQAADVVVLNKMDLVTPEQATAVEALVRAHAPHARLLRATHAVVPLDAVLDVQSSAGGGVEKIGFHTHEKTQATYTPSLDGGGLLRHGAEAAAGTTAGAGHGTHGVHGAHAPADAFHSLSVTLDHSRGPVSLAALLRFVGSPAVTGLVRAKGILWVSSSSSSPPPKSDGLLRGWRCVVHMSGRAPGRWSWELDGRWAGRPHSEIVFIGARGVLDLARLQAACDELLITCSSSGGGGGGGGGSSTAAAATALTRAATDSANPAAPLPTALSAAAVPSPPVRGTEGSAAALTSLLADNRFDVLRDERATPEDTDADALVWIRLTGARQYGFTVEELKMQHRIDLDKVNADFVAAVNASLDEPKAFLALCPFPGIGSAMPLPRSCLTPALWTVMAREAATTLKWAFGKIPACKCD